MPLIRVTNQHPEEKQIRKVFRAIRQQNQRYNHERNSNKSNSHKKEVDEFDLIDATKMLPEMNSSFSGQNNS